MDVQPTNLQQLCDAIMSKQTTVSEKWFQNLFESLPQIIKGILNAEVGQIKCSQSLTSTGLVKGECILYIMKTIIAYTIL